MKNIENPMCENCDARVKSFFADIEKYDLLDLSLNKTYNYYKKGQSIFCEGRRPRGVFCLHSGKIKIHKCGINGKEQIVRFVMPGELLGIRSLISRTNYAATATTLENSVICFISKRNFCALLEKYPEVNNCLMMLLGQMLEEAENKMTSLAQKQVRERLAESLLSINNVFNTNSKIAISKNHAICLSRDDLANIVGTATETVIRLLSEFKDDKLISADGRTITLLDIRGLKKVASICDSE